MAISTFLARVFSIYFIVLGVGVLFNRKWYQDTILKLLSDNSSLLIVTIINIIIGSILVVVHPAFTSNWKVVITVLAWLIMLKGVIHAIAPMSIVKIKQALLQSQMTYNFMILVVLVLGVFLGFHGFY